MVTAENAARYVLYKCTESGTPINNWRLQNILYYLQIAFYTAFHRPCFEEDIEAWACGPVIPGVHFGTVQPGRLPLQFRIQKRPLFLQRMNRKLRTRSSGKRRSALFLSGAGCKEKGPGLGTYL